jgi:ribonuclease Z
MRNDTIAMMLAKGVDIIVHSTMHPVMAPDKGSGTAKVRRPISAMAKRVNTKILMLTHLGPSIGADRQGLWPIPGGALTEARFRQAAQEGGFTGRIIVRTDLAMRLPAK